MQRPNEIPVILDIPTPEPKLGFDAYVSAIRAAILGRGMESQFTIGLYGPWGSGKSSILERLKKDLSDSGSLGNQMITVELDAWRHEGKGEMLPILLWQINEQIKQEADSNVKRNLDGLKNWLKQINQIEIMGVAVGRDAAASTEPKKSNQAVSEYMENLKMFKTLAAKIECPIVVLIDDLDRCSPKYIVRVIESIRLFMDVPGFIFVLAVDYDVIVQALAEEYPHSDPHRFLEKIVQVPFRIPLLQIDDEDDDGKILTALVKDWDEIKSIWFDQIGVDLLGQTIRLALRGNPRQTKRLLNCYMVARYIKWDSSPDQRLLLLALAMQLSWPELFTAFASELEYEAQGNGESKKLINTEAYSGLLTQFAKEDKYFGKFLEDLLRPELVTIAELRMAISLAADIGSGGMETTSGGEDFAEARREFALKGMEIAKSKLSFIELKPKDWDETQNLELREVGQGTDEYGPQCVSFYVNANNKSQGSTIKVVLRYPRGTAPSLRGQICLTRWGKPENSKWCYEADVSTEGSSDTSLQELTSVLSEYGRFVQMRGGF